MGMTNKEAGMLESHALHNPSAKYLITFPEGDQYLCSFENGELVDNDEVDSNLYEEWYELDYKVLKTLVPGPNKKDEYDYIQVSSNNTPESVQYDGKPLYKQ